MPPTLCCCVVKPFDTVVAGAIDDGFLRGTIGVAILIRADTRYVEDCRIGGMPPSCETLRLPRIAKLARTMNIPTHEFVTVDMRGLKAVLTARAQAERVSVSAVVRRAVERELASVGALERPARTGQLACLGGPMVKLSLRLTCVEAGKLAAGASHAGLSRGAYLAALLAGERSQVDSSASRPDRLAALNASCAEVSTLSRNLHHLTSLLRQGQLRAAMEYREMLDTLGADVSEHLAMAAGLLAELRPARTRCVAHQQQPRAAASLEGDHHVRTP